MRNKGTFIVAGLLVVAAVVYLMVTSTGSTARYFLTIEELQALGAEAQERQVTVSGAVLGESIDYDASRPRVAFTIVQVPADPQEVEAAGGLATVLREAVNDPDAPRLQVIYEGIRPEALQHERQAIVRGQLTEEGAFLAEELLLKCPSRYEAAPVEGESGG
jgi:cytochrome c-type biogenesis protein CcmE